MKYNLNNILLIFLILFSSSSLCQVRLPKLISDGMVIQRETEVKIWGWASPNENITVRFNEKDYISTADENGEWLVMLPAMQAGGPFTLIVSADTQIVVNDIMVGDIWICSGQSNMEINMKRVSPLYEKEIAESENPNIRYFEVPDKYNFSAPLKDVSGGLWKKSNPEDVLNFSAVAYFFAKEIYNKYKIPIGLINSALGGSPIQCWMSEDALKEFPEYYDEAMKYKDTAFVNNIIREDRGRIDNWYKISTQNDEGYKNEIVWLNPDLNTSDWDSMKIPGYWADEKLGFVNGVVWFRKDIEVPASMAGKQAKLLLGRIVDADSVFVNGVFVGTTSYQYPPRRYEIPEGVLKEGTNTIVVRIINSSGRGGFVEDKPYEINCEENKIDLKGEWQYKLGTKIERLVGETFIRWKPIGLFNAMIAPLLEYPMKGVIWYQGESNAGNPIEYRKLFPAMINNWRSEWEQGDFPFLFVQLPNYMEPKKEPSESNWALLRESQLKTLSVTNTAMAVAIDIGEWNDIHPLNKKDVGKRLALAAQKIAYGENNIVYSGPLYKSMKVEGNKIIISFTNTGSGLMIKGNSELKQFAIAGEDKKFVWAKAKLENDKVIVWTDEVSNPVAVRYAWADNPDGRSGANLYNKEELPASPFRTDEF